MSSLTVNKEQGTGNSLTVNKEQGTGNSLTVNNEQGTGNSSSLSTDHCYLSTDHCSLSTDHCSLATDHCSLPTDHCSLPTDHCSLSTDHCSLPTDHCSLPTDHCFKQTKIGPIPSGWEIISLIETTDKSNKHSYTGGPFGSDLKSSDYTTSGVPIIQLQNIGDQGKYVDKSRIYTSPEKADQLKACNIYPGEIILKKMMPIARCCIVPDFSDRYLMCSDGIRLAVDKNKFVNKYVYYYLCSERFLTLAESKSSGTTRGRIGLGELKVLPVPIPPLPEQKKIAEVLSTVDDKIDSIEQEIEQTKTLKKGLMQKLLTGQLSVTGTPHTFKGSQLGPIPVGWDLVSLGSLCDKIVGGGTPSRDVVEYYKGEIPWFTVKDFSGALYEYTAQEFITEAAVEQSATNLIPANNIIIATRMGLGRAFINSVPIAINQDLKALFLKENLNSLYVLLWFLSLEEKIERLGTGTTVKGIDLATLRSLSIPLPPLPEQEKIAEILGGVDEKLEVLEDKKEKYTTLKKGLMQKLLTGKIRTVNSEQWTVDSEQ